MRKAWFYRGYRGFIQHELEHLKQYVPTVEKCLDKELKEFEDSIEKEASTMSMEDREFYYELQSETYWQINEVFPNIFRKSLFVAIYTLLENHLIKICEILERNEDYTKNLSAYKNKHRGIFLAQEYIKHETDILFPKQHNIWSEILKYNLLRNIIAHRDGEVGFDERSKKVEDYVRTKTTLTLDEHRIILFSTEFLLEAISTIETFFDLLFDAFPKKSL